MVKSLHSDRNRIVFQKVHQAHTSVEKLSAVLDPFEKFTTDVQLINVAGQGDLHNMADFPYGMALITAYLREQGFKTLLLQYPIWKKNEYYINLLHFKLLYSYSTWNYLVNLWYSGNRKP